MDKTLDERVKMFKQYKLPGQPQTQHLDTRILVSDLYKEIKKLRELLYEVAISGVYKWQLEDDRIGYVEPQIDKNLWKELQEYKK